MAATDHAELILDLRYGNCTIRKNYPIFQTRQDKRRDTISEEYVIEYPDGDKLYIHIHNDENEQSYMIHVKDEPFGNSLFSLGNSWTKFLRLAELTNSIL